MNLILQAIQSLFRKVYITMDEAIAAQDKNIEAAKATAASAVKTAAAKMDAENPAGTGSFSLNRLEGDGLEVGKKSFAAGEKCIASGENAFAMGYRAKVTGNQSFAVGNLCEASGYVSHAEGRSTKASGRYSHAQNQGTEARGAYSHAEGSKTIASGECQHVQGEYNIEDTEGKYAHIVGNGTVTARSNAHTLDWNGVGWFAGGLKVGGTGQDDEAAKEVALKDDIISVTGATVGQTVKISAVDENGVPTAWEAVEFPSGGGGSSEWRLIRKVTIPEDIATDESGVSFAEKSGGGVTFAFDTDENGEGFSLRELVIYSYAGTEHTSSSFSLSTIDNVPYYQPVACIANKSEIGKNGGYAYSISHTIIVNIQKNTDTGYTITSYSFGASFGGGTNNNVYSSAKTMVSVQNDNYGSFPEVDGTIKRINCFMSNLSAYGFKPGSWFEFYGR